MSTGTPVVLFVCVHNAGRSLAARVLLEHHARGRLRVQSAGSEPAEQLNPTVVRLLEARGLDVSREFPKPLTDTVARAADVVVSMGCGDTCPRYPGVRVVDWTFDDPAGRPEVDVARIIEEIDDRVQVLLDEVLASAT